MRSCKYWIFPPFLSFKPFSLHIFIKTWIRNFSPRHNSEMENKQTWKFLRKCNPRDSLSTCPLKKIILFFFLLHPPPPSSSLSQSESKHSDSCLRYRLKKFVTVAFFFFHIFTLLRLDKIFQSQENRKFAVHIFAPFHFHPLSNETRFDDRLRWFSEGKIWSNA